MPDDEQMIRCDVHGDQPETFLCQHVVTSLFTSQPVGFWWADDPGNPHPDAWCTACNEVLKEENGEWTKGPNPLPTSSCFAQSAMRKQGNSIFQSGVNSGPIPHNNGVHWDATIASSK